MNRNLYWRTSGGVKRGCFLANRGDGIFLIFVLQKSGKTEGSCDGQSHSHILCPDTPFVPFNVSLRNQSALQIKGNRMSEIQESSRDVSNVLEKISVKLEWPELRLNETTRMWAPYPRMSSDVDWCRKRAVLWIIRTQLSLQTAI